MTVLPTLEDLVRHPERSDALLEKLNLQAKQTCAYECGLPLWDEGQKAAMREIILRWALGD